VSIKILRRSHWQGQKLLLGSAAKGKSSNSSQCRLKGDGTEGEKRYTGYAFYCCVRMGNCDA